MRIIDAGVMGLLGLALAAPAQAEVKDATPTGFTIENSVIVPADAATAWRALVDDVDQWWPKDHSWWGAASKLSIDARAGGCFCEIAGAQQALHMTVTHVDPGKLMRMIGGLGPLQGMGLGGALEWRFVKADGGTRITLSYRAGGYTPDDLTKFAVAVDKVQGQQLGGLAEHLRKRATTSAKE
ncbi:MAG: SRPBCC family protein [Luteimonas sp.]|nr:SRPBCC family protein [Luteimonas sp.]